MVIVGLDLFYIVVRLDVLLKFDTRFFSYTFLDSHVAGILISS